MNLFETILIHIVSITFPLVLYLFYLAYQKGIGKEENKLLLDFAFISSFYLSTRFYMMGSSEINYLFLHIPLWMAYCYRQPFSIFVISILSFNVNRLLAPSSINLSPPSFTSINPYEPLRKCITASHSSPVLSL